MLNLVNRQVELLYCRQDENFSNRNSRVSKAQENPKDRIDEMVKNMEYSNK